MNNDNTNFSFASASNLSFIESLYERFRQDPQSVEASWRHFFEGMDFATLAFKKERIKGGKASDDLRVYHLIQAYRTYGHLLAKCDTIAMHHIERTPELDLKNLGFEENELNNPFPTCGFLPEPGVPLKVLIEALRKTYCGTTGFEYMDLGLPEVEKWLQKRIEPYFQVNLTKEQKIKILHTLNRAELFENFIHTKYVGQKRFSLEGGETLIPILSTILEEGVDVGVREVILGMAHRGRLNVLANILNKSYAHIFTEFEDYYSPDLMESTGDVKYHKGFVGALTTEKGINVQITLMANPSHLESVDPVVEGFSRAKQEQIHDKNKIKQIVPILIHGDAALAGQGVVYETLQMSRLNGYGTGGTVHIVINNQIGFTTLPKDTRSTRYCTDIAKAFGAPVFHVNAERPEECVLIAKLAIEIRQQFQCDVFIDLNCYRKYGHNESDEPTFTQPHEYHIIKNKKPIRELFRDQLIQEGVLTQSQAQGLEEEFKNNLQKALDQAKSFGQNASVSAKPASNKEDLFSPVHTAVSQSSLIEMAERFCRIPEGFTLHPKIQRLFQDRLNMIRAEASQKTIDWGMGEYLAYASLLWEGKHVRLSGQDSRRGTFTHRHAIWIDQAKEQKYFPLSHLKEGQGLFDVFNSHLSEFAVMGFEFGYTLGNPKALVMWEAQFGDFANGAQIIIDQYLSSSEQKWTHTSNLVLLLPHGMEGQGPEHSSARQERFLQLCSDDNLQIVNCSTPAQLFHVLRRQVLRTLHKPLVIFTPKALLRHPECVSAPKDFSEGGFQEVIDDPSINGQAKKCYFCSGKVYYDLLAEREKRKISDIALVRIEQLYPFPMQKIKSLIEKYAKVQEWAWVQEEQSNSGAWEYIRPILEKELGNKTFRYIGRPRSASPAVGTHALHKKQFIQMMDEAFKG